MPETVLVLEMKRAWWWALGALEPGGPSPRGPGQGHNLSEFRIFLGGGGATGVERSGCSVNVPFRKMVFF